jgi:inorganic phosphate transporter, PiT family
MTTYVIIIIFIALFFDFCNGMNDAANSIATVVATRVLSPRLAVLWAAFFNFIAAFFFETHVASTIGKGLVSPNVIDPHLILATLLAAITWSIICTRKGLPISVSHALIGGLAGSALVKGGMWALAWSKMGLLAAFIVLAPVIGLICAAVITVATMWICRNKAPRKVDGTFRVLQLVSAAVYSLSHGLNDAQKTMGIILALLLSVPALEHYAYRGGDRIAAESRLEAATAPAPSTHGSTPIAAPAGGAAGMSAGPRRPAEVRPAEPKLNWLIILSCHGAIALGTYCGGWQNIRTLGHRVTKLQPFDGFSAETAGGITIVTMSMLGIPVSTTHTITGSIFGVGIVRRFGSVRWSVGQDIVTAWVLTMPSAAGMAAAIYWILHWFV